TAAGLGDLASRREQQRRRSRGRQSAHFAGQQRLNERLRTGQRLGRDRGRENAVEALKQRAGLRLHIVESAVKFLEECREEAAAQRRLRAATVEHGDTRQSGEAAV